MTIFVDSKSLHSCINVIKKLMSNDSCITSSHMLLVTKLYTEYQSYINTFFPTNITNTIIEYCHESFNAECKIQRDMNKPKHYILFVTSNELHISFRMLIYLQHNNVWISDLIIKGLLNIQDTITFINYYMMKKISKKYLNTMNYFVNEKEIILYDNQIKRMNYDKFITELVIIQSLFNRINMKKIDNL